MAAADNPVILAYHSIAEIRSPLCVSPQLFAVQMEWLKGNARVVPLGEVAESVVARRPLPPRTVVLTFDDGFADFTSAAAPVLLRLGLPATVFLPTAFCGGRNDWRGQPAWVAPQPLLAWSDVQLLAAQGFAFGAHSRTHPDLTRIPPEIAEAEIVGSRREIEEHTGKAAEFFCYPYGAWNSSVREMVSRHFRGACSTAAGSVQAGADPFALPRVDAHYLRSRNLFERLFTPALDAYVGLRRWIRRVRGQPEGNYARI
jgi:peptidoglycan/xylan/chitin deacetylase (PgdA/CDA1 family)